MPSVTTRNTHSNPSPPGPRGYPFVGILPEMFRRPLEYLERVAQDYGPVARMRFMRHDIYLVSSPDAIQHVLQDNAQNYWKGRGLSVTRPLLGNGLATSEGELWHQQRRLLQPLFTTQSVRRHTSNLANDVLRSCRYAIGTKEAPTNISALMNRLTQELLLDVLFGSALGEEASALQSALKVAQRHIYVRAWMPLAVPSTIPTPGAIRFRRAIQVINRIVYAMIARRKETGAERDDVLSRLVASANSERSDKAASPEADRQARDEVVTLLFAAHETTAAALTWNAYLLSRHPDVRARVAAESESATTQQGLAHAELPYTLQVVHEALRLYPPGWIMVRTAREADELSGYEIPAAATLLISPYVTHRLPAHWQKPTEYRPDRFSPGERETTPRFAYLPFGGGPRLCIGNHLALLILQTASAVLCRDFAFEPLDDRPLRPRPLTTLQPTRDLWLRIAPKSTSNAP